MELRRIETFGVLGAGTLGWRIGLRAALSGYAVLTHDISPAQLGRAAGFQRDFADRLVRKSAVTRAEADAALGRLASTPDAEAFANAVDFVSESVTEDLDLKRRVWSGLRGAWRRGAILTTNTSYLLPSDLVDAVGEPARFCAFHFHDVFEARVVDVMPHPATAPEVVARLTSLGRELAQVPVHVRRETRGYLFNHMLMAYLGAAGQLLARDKADVEDIDRSWMGNLGVRIGPFGMMDQIGLDTVDHVLRARTDARSRAFRELIAPMLAAGHLGVKSGRGFYRYPRPAYAAPDFLAGPSSATAHESSGA